MRALPVPPFLNRTWLVGFFVAIWLTALAAGFYAMARYDTTPGEAHAAPIFWPTASALQPSKDGWNLVVFVHPQCPCSRASLDELNVIMNQATNVTAQAVFMKPTDRADEWAHTYTWQAAGSMRHVTRWLDVGGVETARFRAETSGFVLLYDATGRLRFSGGITGARGEDGDNVGLESVLQLLAGKPAARATHEVFGCSLVSCPAANGPLAERGRP